MTQAQPERSDVETVELSAVTGMTLQRIRSVELADSVEQDLDHVRCNVLMRKGLVRNLGPGKWQATELGRRVAVRMR